MADWFADYRATNVRLFTYPRPTVAARHAHRRYWQTLKGRPAPW